jgi:tetratricopeptide (TPR) repeat protein
MLELEKKVWLAEDQDLPSLEREIARIIQTTPRSAMAHYLMAMVLKRSFAQDPGDLLFLKQASQTAQQAIDLDPTQSYGYIALADLLDLMGNGDKGLALLTEIETSGIAEPNWRFYFTRARLQASDSNAIKTLGMLETALSFVDTQKEIIIPYVVALLRVEYKGRRLERELQTWQKKYPSNLFKLTLAIEYGEAKKFTKANKLYTEILASDPHNREAKINNAILHYRNLKNPKLALKMFDEVVKDKTDNLPAPVMAIVQSHIGAAHVAARNFKSANTSFEEALRLDQDNLNLLDFIARTYKTQMADGELVKFIKNYNKRQAGSGVMYALLAETLSEKLGQHDEAIEAFGDAIVLDPDRSDYYNGMGLAFYRKKQYRVALEVFTEATKIDPNDAVAAYNEACVLSLLNRKPEALARLKDAVSLDPKLLETAQTDTDLNNIRQESDFNEIIPKTMIGH